MEVAYTCRLLYRHIINISEMEPKTFPDEELTRSTSVSNTSGLVGGTTDLAPWFDEHNDRVSEEVREMNE